MRVSFRCGCELASTLSIIMLSAIMLSAIMLSAGSVLGQSAPVGSPTSAAATSEADILAADGLRLSAMSLVYASPKTPGRAGRLVALTQYADRLVPNDPKTNWLLANIYESQEKLPQAAAALEVCLKADPANHALGERWLRAAVTALNNADDRLKFLADVIARQDLPAPLRADAAAMSAGVLHNQKEDAKALAAFEQALKLDPYHRESLEGRLALQTKPTNTDRVATMLNLLRGSPTYMTAGWELAQTLDSMGLFEQSRMFYDYCWTLAQLRNADSGDEMQTFIAQYFSASLDAATAGDDAAARAEAVAKVLKTFEPLVLKYPRSVDLQAMMIEAYRQSNNAAKADEIVAFLKTAYKERSTQPASIPAGLAAELAWFNLVTIAQPAVALDYAKKAIQAGNDDPVLQRILGCAEIASKQADIRDDGIKLLAPLAAKDVYAAAFLIEYYSAAKDNVKLQQVVQTAVDLPCGGPGWRRFVQALRSAGVAVPAPAGDAATTAQAVGKLISDFNPQYLQMIQTPEKFLTVTITPVAKDGLFAFGAPVCVEVTLSNIGPVAVPLGDGGLFAPVVGLQAKNPAAAAPGQTYTNLPLALLPASRYLQPGQSVKCVVELDMGGLAGPLASNPLGDVTFEISGVIDPIQRGQSFSSSLPNLLVKSVTITRRGLLSGVDASGPEQMAAEYRLALGVIAQNDIIRGQLPARLAACRQTAWLLAYAQLVEQRKATLPKGLEKDFAKLPLLAMMQALLADRSPVVRAAALAAISNDVAVDDAILSLIGPAIADRSSLVRLRAAELLGVASQIGTAQQQALGVLAKDADAIVQIMAKTFTPTK